MHPVIGLDFGTTNSAIAVAEPNKPAALARFGETSSFRSILYFPHKERSSQHSSSTVKKGSTAKPETKAGPEAISSYLDADTKGRLILSIKSYLASRLFTSTQINEDFWHRKDEGR